MTSALPNDDPIRSMLREENRFAELLAGGPVTRAIEEYRRLDGIVGIEHMRRVLEQHQSLTEQLGADPIRQMAEDHRRIDGLMRRLIAEQDRFAALARGPVQEMTEQILRLAEQQNRFAAELDSPAFDAYRRMVTDAVESISGEPEPEPADDSVVHLGDWVPTRGQAELLADVADFVVSLLLLLSAIAGVRLPPTAVDAANALLRFAVLMTRHARRR